MSTVEYLEKFCTSTYHEPINIYNSAWAPTTNLLTSTILHEHLPRTY